MSDQSAVETGAQAREASDEIVLGVLDGFLGARNAGDLVQDLRDVAEANLERQRKALDIARRRYKAGIGTQLEITQAIQWLVEREYARTAEDVLWRRTKLGLHMSEAEKQALAERLGG